MSLFRNIIVNVIAQNGKYKMAMVILAMGLMFVVCGTFWESGREMAKSNFDVRSFQNQERDPPAELARLLIKSGFSELRKGRLEKARERAVLGLFLNPEDESVKLLNKDLTIK